MTDTRVTDTDLLHAVIEQTPFSPWFEIRGGLSADDALAAASCLLETALELRFPENPQDSYQEASAVAFAVSHFMAGAKALLNAAHAAQIKARSEVHHG